MTKNPSYDVYVITNLVNGLKYVGVTKNGIWRRLSVHFWNAKKWKGSPALSAAIRDFGEEFFNIEILETFSNASSALAAEAHYVENLQPAYNIHKGGRGQVSGEMPQKSLQKLSVNSTGNYYRRGATHTDRVKNRLKAVALDNNEIWKRFRPLGPAALSRSVICLDDGRIFRSASEAAREYGSAKSAIIELCLGKRYRKTVNGRRFSYVKDGKADA